MKQLVFIYAKCEITIDRLEEDLYRMALWDRYDNRRGALHTVWETTLKYTKANMKDTGSVMVHASMLTQLQIKE